MPIRVLIADASADVRARLLATVRGRDDMAIVGEASGGAETLSECFRLRPDVLVLDVVHPNTNSITVLEGIRRGGLPTRVIALTDGDSKHWIRLAIDAGASGCLLKDDLSGMAVLIERVHGGNQVLPLEEQPGDEWQHRLDELTVRERQVLDLIFQGKTSRDIASLLGISSRTVDAHRASIMKKLHVRSVVELVRLQVSGRPPDDRGAAAPSPPGSRRT